MSPLYLSLAAAVLLALSTTAVTAARAHEPKPLIDPAEMTSLWWIFLASGENKTPLPKEEAQKMQQGHIGNLERLGKEGKAVAAGPFGDRTPLRGIVVLTVKSREEAQAEFKDDPFVQAGRLIAEQHPLFLAKGTLDPAK